MSPADDRLRVLQVLASPGWGGTERAFVDLCNALSRESAVTAVVPASASYRSRFEPGVRVVDLPAGSRRNPLTLLKLARLIRAERPDLVHSHAAKAAEMVHWATRTNPVPHVATKHNTRPRWIFSRVPAVTAVSEQARAAIRGRNDVHLVYNGVPQIVRPSASRAERFTVIGVGRLHEHKAFERLVRAVAALPFDCSLQIAGDGPERARLEALVEELGVTERVALLGHREDVPDLLAAAHVQVVSSTTEGFSLALVEGLLYCDVVLSTRVGIAPEILPGELLVEPDGIAERLTDVRGRYEHYVGVARRARAAARERFTIEATVRGYGRIYEVVRA